MIKEILREMTVYLTVFFVLLFFSALLQAQQIVYVVPALPQQLQPPRQERIERLLPSFPQDRQNVRESLINVERVDVPITVNGALFDSLLGLRREDKTERLQRGPLRRLFGCREPEQDKRQQIVYYIITR